MAEDSGAGVDFAAVAYLEEGMWQVTAVPTRTARELHSLVRALRQLPADSGALGLVSVDDDFFVLARVEGEDVRCLLSDVTAATEWPLAREVLDELDLPLPEGEEEDRPQPAGDLGIVADLGMGAMDMGVLCDDLELYPDDMLTEIAEQLGFGPAFRRVIDAVAG